ncbi:MAG: class IIb bacteriocin, lactobin A/cerein 7B family [Clostridium sp.]
MKELNFDELTEINGGIGVVAGILIIAGIAFVAGSVRGCAKADGK